MIWFPSSRITITEMARATGKTWEEVAKEKMKADFKVFGGALVIIIVLLLIF